jgi:hypothetical protein
MIASIATLHHLPLEPALRRFRDLLWPGGVLVVIGLHPIQTMSDFVYGCLAMPVVWWMRATRPVEPVLAPIRDPDESLDEIRTAVEKILPGVQFKRQLLFRYSMIWQKPALEAELHLERRQTPLSFLKPSKKMTLKQLSLLADMFEHSEVS